MTALDEDTRVEVHDPGDHEKFAHIVIPKWKVTEAYMTGTPVQALCGKVWIPNRDPERFPTCKRCVEVLNEARAAQGKSPVDL